MNQGRSHHTATLLPDGRVLVTGGYAGAGYATTSCEIYDPEADSWTTVAAMGVRRYGHVAIPLGPYRIMVIGGRQGNSDGGGAMAIWAPLSSCEIYNVDGDDWQAAGSMNEPRVTGGAVALTDGRVMVAGGINERELIDDWSQPASQTCEIYDPVTNTWNYTASLASERNYLKLVSLDDNSIMAIGGEIDQGALADCYLYDVNDAVWTEAATMNSGRIISEVVTLPDGNVLTVGGWHYLWSEQTGTAEIYNVDDDDWAEIDTLEQKRGWHSATLLNTGEILVVGGINHQAPLKSCEVLRSCEPGALDVFAIGDIPRDNGGQVRIYWSSHRYDGTKSGNEPIASYSVYLADDENGSAVDGLPGRWRDVGSVNATGAPHYSLIVETLDDFTSPDGARDSWMAVIASTASGTDYVSDITPSNSYDNMGPEAVVNLKAVDIYEASRLTWSPSPSADVSHYMIYHGSSPKMAIDPANLVATTEGTSFEETHNGTMRYYYRVVPVDHAGNMGRASEPMLATISGVDATTGDNASIAIGSIYPQPASGTVTIPLQLATASSVRISLFDELGQRVGGVIPTTMAAGHHQIQVDVQNLPSGAYTCMIHAGEHAVARKLVIQR